MKTKFLYAIALGWILLGVIGCTSTGPSTPGTTPSATQAATGTPQPGNVQAVDFNKLIQYLPKAPFGYQETTPPTGARLTSPEGSYSVASVTWDKKFGEGYIDATVSITDSAYYNVGMFSAWKSFVSYETTNAYVKSTTVGKYPAYKTWTKTKVDSTEVNEYWLHVALNDRFMVSIHTYDETALNQIRDSINYDGIAALR